MRTIITTPLHCLTSSNLHTFSVIYNMSVCVYAVPSVKVRGHNLIWSVGQYVQQWVQQLSGDDLRRAVRHHIQETMNVTRGL